MTNDESVSTRERVLTEIRTASAAPTVEDLTTTLGLHRNSVRAHTAALQEAGLIEQDTRQTGGRGRPLTVYRPTRRGARAGGRNYELLAEVLVDHLARTEDHPERAARQAGRAWGGRLAAERPSEAEALVPAVLDELGFEPHHAEAEIELRNCPFRELVDSHQGLVCALHAGMLDGLAEEAGAVATLLPFATPTSCAVRITP